MNYPIVYILCLMYAYILCLMYVYILCLMYVYIKLLKYAYILCLISAMHICQSMVRQNLAIANYRDPYLIVCNAIRAFWKLVFRREYLADMDASLLCYYKHCFGWHIGSLKSV